MTLQRKRRLTFLGTLFIIGAALLGWSAIAQTGGDPTSEGVILTIDGAISPPVADYVAREIENASDAGKGLILIEIDTPGGLVDSMKTIIKSILASDTPVATYVSPQGARSASAGLYIMYAAHVSAMAPATNTGAATPVELGAPPSDDSPLEENPFEETSPADETNRDVNQPAPSNGGADAEDIDDGDQRVPESTRDQDRTVTAEDIETTTDTVSDAVETVRPRDSDNPLSNDGALRAKTVNDSVAYIRALAEARGRNADWAEEAVREAASITANEALKINVIDLIADDIDDLLAQIDGQTVSVASGDVVLATENIRLERIEPTLLEQILSFIANPNVAVILMSLATTGIIIEMWNPGSIFPGAVGLMCFILGLYSFNVLPFDWLGVALMIAGAIFILVEAFTPTLGLVGLVGLLVFGAGLYTVFPEGYRVSPVVLASILAVGGAFLALVLFAIVGSRSHGPLIGSEAIRRREGVVDEWNGNEGWVIVDGERWRARSDKPLSQGDKIRVVEVEGLVLVVKLARANGLLSALQPSEA